MPYVSLAAFKLDSKIPPDRLQTVKDHKAMMASLDALKKALGGKPAEASQAYAAAKAKTDAYLEGVELPKIGDAQYQP